VDSHELKKLAIDIVDGKVFGSWMLSKQEERLIPNIFLPIAVGGSEHLPQDVYGLYEYYDKALPLSVNGKPTFTSCKFITQSDCQTLNPLIEKYNKVKLEFLDDTSSSDSDHVDEPAE
jgi:hypothetical protein